MVQRKNVLVALAVLLSIIIVGGALIFWYYKLSGGKKVEVTEGVRLSPEEEYNILHSTSSEKAIDIGNKKQTEVLVSKDTKAKPVTLSPEEEQKILNH